MSEGTQASSVVCNHCGAALDVPPGTRFVTCSYCGRKLQIHHTGSAIYTEVLDSIDQRTQQMAADIQDLKRQNELEALDREWTQQREQYLVRSRHGNTSEPSAFGSVVGAIMAAVFGIFWIGGASAGAPWFFPLFGVVFVIAAIVMGIHGVAKSARFRSARSEYQQRRDELMRNQPPQP
jgi:LSD1 subclass zinc finger protein